MTSMGMGGSIVSKNLICGKGRLKWCFREKPANSLDNGWRFLSDIDTNEYLSDSSNMVVCDLATVVNIEPAILGIINYPIGTDLTLIRKENRMEFVDTKTGEAISL